MSPSVDAALVRAHGLAALVTLLVAVLFGILAATALVLPNHAATVPWLGWGRVRYGHTQGIMLGWLGNAFFAFLYHAVPLLTGRSVTSARLGRWLFGLWNVAVLVPGWILVLAGYSQPLEWAEFPLAVDAVVVVCLVLAAIQFLPPFFRRGLESLYVSSWYVIGGLVFTLLAYPMGNFVPEFVPGAQGAAYSGLWIHDAIGLFVTPLALAIIYYVVPAASGRPIYSHFLSMLGFWLLFFVYPLNGTHHYVMSVIPMEAQMAAIAASTILGVTVVIVVTNILLSLRGTGLIATDLGLRFVATSTVFYLIVSIQGAMQAQMSINQAVHFTDWVVGHSHLAMLGFATFAACGGLVHVWQRLPGARYSRRAITWAYWLLVVGVVVMVADLTAAGLVQAASWNAGAPWMESVRATRPYWIVRLLSAVPITAGFVALLVGITRGTVGGGVAEIVADGRAAATAPARVAPTLAADGSGRALRTSYVVAGLGGVVFFGMSVALLGIWPARVLEAQSQAMGPAHEIPLTESEVRGRDIYSREGCAYCHTQQVRLVESDMARFGAPTLAWETRLDYPHLWGTRRIGPDLSRAYGTRSEDWHFAHLFNPRSVVADSVMPPYAMLFDGAPTRPRQEARDLVAYLESLGRARELAGPEGEARAHAACACDDDPMAAMAFHSPVINASPARRRRGGEVPPLSAHGDLERGRRAYAANCAVCHGPTGRGDGPGAAALRPKPADLSAHTYTRARLADVLWNGVDGTAMQAWRDHAPDTLADLTEAVRALSTRPAAAQASDTDLAAGRAVYDANCAQCHGTSGHGDGWSARQQRVPPSSFRAQRASLEVVRRALQEGVDGTSMAPWTTRLTPGDLEAVARYVQSLYAEDEEGGAP